MEDYRLEQSGQEVQDILNGAAMQVDLTAETERAELAETTLQGNIDVEERDRKDADLTLQGNIDAEEIRAKAAEKQNADDIDALEEKVPSGASSSNKLATEEYVDDSVATATATFRGTYNLVSDLHLTVNATEQQIATALALAISTADNNDYCFVQVPTSSETPTEIKEINRYKFNGTAWSFEYKLNNSGFTAAQWAAINSGITSGDVTKLAALPTNAELTTLLNGKQDVLTFDNVPTEGSSRPVKSGGVYSAIDDEKTARENSDSSLSSAIEAILLLIPSAATSLNKLADKAFVNSSIATASATFRGTYNLVTDLSLTVSATHAQIATALAGAVSDEDNNDYTFVQIPTSDATPTQVAKTERYKYNGTIWEYEYDLNNSGYTAAQWAAINSGITEALVAKLSALPTNTELTSALGVLTSSITTINQKIPSAASQANQLVDTAAMEAYIVQVLDVLTASFNVTSTDGHVTVSISQVDGKITSVAVSTSDIASAASLSLIAGRVTTAEGNISTNAADIANLQDAYAALTQSALVVVQPTDTWPVASPATKTIYRVVDRVNTPPQYYSDYMWNGTAMVLMATYDNAIDDFPTEDSPNVVKSGGIAAYYGSYKETPEFVKMQLDEEDKFLEGIRKDGTKVLGGDLLVNGDAKVIGETNIGGVLCKVVENPEWLEVHIDNGGKVLSGVKRNGDFFAGNTNITKLGKNIKSLSNAVYVAANDAPDSFKVVADFVCDGENDEFDISNALAMAGNTGKVVLSSGTFNIDSFRKAYDAGPNDYLVAIALPWFDGDTWELTLEGAGRSGKNATILNIREGAWESISSEIQPNVIASAPFCVYATLHVRDLQFQMPDNQRKVCLVNYQYLGGGNMERIFAQAAANSFAEIYPVEGCVAFRSYFGSDTGTVQLWKHCVVIGFYEAFQIGAEHHILMNCGGRFNYYCYTFGNYDYEQGTNDHPICLINCNDEHSACLPLFNRCGFHSDTPDTEWDIISEHPMQSVTFIAHNFEDGALNLSVPIVKAHEETPNSWCGIIEYTCGGSGENSKLFTVWDANSGKSFKTVNLAHALGGSTAQRNGYNPNYLQQYFDETLNKMLVYNGSRWVDFNGNNV